MKDFLVFLKKIDWIVVSVLLFLPIILAFSLLWYSRKYTISWKECYITISTFYILTITVGVAIHRLWAHAAFKMNKILEFLFMLLASATLQGSVIGWASDHERHHSFTDTERDPHTPLKFKNKVLGFLWSHIGWMMLSGKKEITKNTISRLGKNKILVWQFKYYWQLAVSMNTIVPSLIGYLLFDDTIQGILAGLIFMGVGRALQQQVTFLINSITHFVGEKDYSNGSAGDIWWLFIILFGENWHNFHHTFANDYRNGHKWYHFDVHKWIIFLLSKIGFAWDLVCTPDERIRAKVKYESNNTIKDLQIRLDNFIKDLSKDITVLAQQIKGLHISQGINHVKQKLVLLRVEALQLQQKVSDFRSSDIVSLKVLNILKSDLSFLEKKWLKLIKSEKLLLV